MCKKVIKGWEVLWDEYCRLHREKKELHVHVRIYVVREKKVGVWNKVNADLDGSRKEFYVGRGTKTNNTLQRHCQHLGYIDVNSVFNAD